MSGMQNDWCETTGVQLVRSKAALCRSTSIYAGSDPSSEGALPCWKGLYYTRTWSPGRPDRKQWHCRKVFAIRAARMRLSRQQIRLGLSWLESQTR